MTSEFDFIANLRKLAFSSITEQSALNFEDDVCIISKSNNKIIIASKDIITEKTHFFDNDPLDLVVKKAIRTNISDMAAKGAKLYGMMIGLLLPPKYQCNASMQIIEKSLAEEIEYYDIPFLGGDTVASENFSISITILGECKTMPPLRKNAKVDDKIYITGTLGKSHAGLLIRLGKLEKTDYNASYLNDYMLPDPPYLLGQALSPYMNAACDISDGLLADLEHILNASNVGAVINPALLPCAQATNDSFINQQYALTCGDDYQILFTSHSTHAEIENFSMKYNTPITQIGTITKEKKIVLLTDHKVVQKGYHNF